MALWTIPLGIVSEAAEQGGKGETSSGYSCVWRN